MINIENAVIAKLKKNNQEFEILVDCENALKMRRGEKVELNELLAVMKIFKDAKKGDVAPNLKENFGTDNIEDIAKEIITKGEIQLSASYKKKLLEQKKNEIVGALVRNAMDPINKNPIPRARIEIAFEKANIHLHPFKPSNEQLPEVFEALKKVMPITLENKKFEILIPAAYASICYGLLKKYGKIIREDWLSSGSLQVIVEMPAGLSEEFVDVLNKKTGGDIQIAEK